MLRRLDRLVGFPEQTAISLMRAEMEILGEADVKTLMCGLGEDLSGGKDVKGDRRRWKLAQKLVVHFYLVRNENEIALFERAPFLTQSYFRRSPLTSPSEKLGRNRGEREGRGKKAVMRRIFCVFVPTETTTGEGNQTL